MLKAFIVYNIIWVLVALGMCAQELFKYWCYKRWHLYRRGSRLGRIGFMYSMNKFTTPGINCFCAFLICSPIGQYFWIRDLFKKKKTA